MPITLQNVLQMECMQNAILATKISNPSEILVTGITIIEAPDIADWINGGEILLSSFYSVFEDPEAQKTLLQNLINHRAAALLIKTSRFLHQIPEALLKIADDAGFPIIEIPGSLHYIDIMYPIMSLLFNDQVHKLNYFKQCHKTFTDLLIHTRGTPTILQQLENLVDNPVLLLDASMQHIISAPTYKEASLESLVCQDSAKESQIILCRCTLASAPHNPQNLWTRPVEVLNRVYAHLAILEKNRPIGEMDFIALDNAVTTLRLEQLQNIIAQETENQFKNDFILQLLHNQTLSHDELAEKSGALGIDLHKKYLVGILEFHGLHPWAQEGGNPLESLRLFHSQLKTLTGKVSYFFTSSKDFFYTSTENRMLFLWPCGVADKREVYGVLRAFIQHFQEEFARFFPQFTLSCGIGCPVEDILLTKDSYAQASDALWVSKHFSLSSSPLFIYDELGIYKLLSAIRDFQHLERFIPQGLKTLQAYDQEKNQELISTLETYLACDLNAVKTSELLFLHHKTVLYRLKKIREITRMDFTAHEQRLELEMGLKILSMLK